MRHLKRLGLLALVAAAASAFTGSASATSLTSPTGTVSTPTITLESEGHVTVDAKLSKAPEKVACNWIFKGTVESHGEGKPTVLPLTKAEISGCTNNWHGTVESPGKLEIVSTSGYNGTVTWSGGTILLTKFSVPCRYISEDTHIGNLIGGSPATLTLEGKLKLHQFSSPFCYIEESEEAEYSLTGSLAVNSPESLFVDKSGTNITSPTGTVATPTIKAESEGHIAIDHPLASFQCQWAFEGTVESHSGGNAVVPLSSLTTTSCTDSWHATTVSPGKLEIVSTSGYNGTVRWTGGTVEMTRLGTTCRYKSENTHLGTLTGGTPATIHIEGKIPFHSGSSLCGEEAHPLTGSFKVTSPSSLFVDKAS